MRESHGCPPLSPVCQRWIAIEGGLLLVVLHVRCERGGRIVAAIAHSALKRFLVVVRLHVDLQVIAVRSISFEFTEKRKLIFHEIACDTSSDSRRIINKIDCSNG